MGLKVALVGGPGSGKTLLAKALVIHLRLKQHDAVICDEYIREYLRDSGMIEHYGEQFPILHGSSYREDSLQSIHDIVVCDGASFFGETYMAYYRPQNMTVAEERKWEFAYDIVRRLARQRLKTFDHLFLVPKGDFVQSVDPQRFNVDDAEEMSAALRGYLDYQRIPYTLVKTNQLEDRVVEVAGYLSDILGIDMESNPAEYHDATRSTADIRDIEQAANVDDDAADATAIEQLLNN